MTTTGHICKGLICMCHEQIRREERAIRAYRWAQAIALSVIINVAAAMAGWWLACEGII